MSLHVSGQEAQSCLKFLERAMQRWEAEQVRLRQLEASRDKTQRAKLKRDHKAERRQRKWAARTAAKRQWSPEQLAAMRAGITAGRKISDVARELAVPYTAAWVKHTELCHEMRRSA